LIPEHASILLDTGIVIVLARGREAGHSLDRRYALSARREVPLISVVTVGELLLFARTNGWGEEKERRLRHLLENLVIVDVHNDAVLDAYAELGAFARSVGRRMGQQNDVWIAATARATGSVLLTLDSDFDFLHPTYLQREWVDQSSLR
jgi:tRNA(fMet)-specific endonuclease VapC